MTEIFEKVKEAADYIYARAAIMPKIAIICGSGLSAIGDHVTDPIVIKYKDIPSFHTTSVQGHKSQLVLGKLSGKDVICMQGRFHPYEGYPAWVPGFPLKVFAQLGVEIVIITNAVGGINPDFSVGDFMIIKDHISFMSLGGYNPLNGPNDDRIGLRFPSLLNLYDADLRKQLGDCAVKLGYESFVKEGIYMQVAGPSYETIAEVRMIRALGGDAVGMSTTQEAIAARHAGLKVIACSLITNKSIMEYDVDATICHEEVLETSKMRGETMVKLMAHFIENLK